LACNEFPTCHGGLWWPSADFAAGFSLWRPLGVDYEFGTLDSPARTAIHLAHRVGALTVLVLVGALAWHVARAAPTTSQRRLGGLLLLVLGTQATLGIANVLGRLPLPVAVAHTAGAALLLATVLTLIHALTPATRERDA
jgi:cytochrome c oxidase assembly protein subunit 15